MARGWDGGAAGGGALLLLFLGPICICACLLLASSRRQRDRARAGAVTLLDRCSVGGGSSARFGEAQEKLPLTDGAEAGGEAEADTEADTEVEAGAGAGGGADFDALGGGAAAHVREAVRRALGGDEVDARELMALALREASSHHRARGAGAESSATALIE